MYVLQEENRGVMPVPPMVVAMSSNNYLPFFSTEGTAGQRMVPSEKESKNWWVVIETEGRKQDVVLNLCAQTSLPSGRKQGLSDTCSTK